MPPEFHDGYMSCEASFDVFSFGQLSLYTIVQEFPLPTELTYIDSTNPGVILCRSEIQRRLQHIEKFTRLIGRVAESLATLTVKCLHNDPRQRPSVKQMSCELNGWMKEDDTFEQMAKVEVMVQAEVIKVNLGQILIQYI